VRATEANSRVGGDVDRVDHAAAVLEQLRDAIGRYNLGERGDTSYTWRMSGLTNKRGGVNPRSLSQLTNQVTSTGLNSCGLQVGSTVAANWLRNFYIQPLATGATFKIADGFVANDQLERFDAAGNPSTINTANFTTPGTLAIVMTNVSLSDAQALAARMEGDQSGGALSVVRFTANGDAPVTVRYHIAIHGC
jgi:hypothetical protein